MGEPETTILVVEDEESFVEALTVGLKREGFRVIVGRDGAEALTLFHAVRPDLVLLDVMLPKISGIDVCREIRTHSRVPIIMVTAKTSEIDTVVGLEVGADDYVSKPSMPGSIRSSTTSRGCSSATADRPERPSLRHTTRNPSRSR